MSRVIIAGTRDFNNYPLLCRKLDYFLQNLTNIEIVSGCARGADQMGEKYAQDHGLFIKRFPADWDSNGKAAGPIRNTQMADYGTHLVAFWDGESKGTKNMIDTAKKKGLDIRILKTM